MSIRSMHETTITLKLDWPFPAEAAASLRMFTSLDDSDALASRK